MLMWRRVEKEVAEDGAKASEGVECEREEHHVILEDVADNLVAEDGCRRRRITLVDTTEFPFFRELKM